jgi:hypothetical protein
MTTPAPSRRPSRRTGAPALTLAILLLATVPSPSHGRMGDAARQVTLFGIIASPGDPTIDSRLEPIAPQLRKILPNHGFRLIDVRSKRLAVGQSLSCDLGGGFVASTILVRTLDENGKVELRCELMQDTIPKLATLVATPPNQLFFCDKQLPNGNRLLIGVGAR